MSRAVRGSLRSGSLAAEGDGGGERGRELSFSLFSPRGQVSLVSLECATHVSSFMVMISCGSLPVYMPKDMYLAEEGGGSRGHGGGSHEVMREGESRGREGHEGGR